MQETKDTGQKDASVINNNFISKDISKPPLVSRAKAYNVMSARHKRVKSTRPDDQQKNADKTEVPMSSTVIAADSLEIDSQPNTQNVSKEPNKSDQTVPVIQSLPIVNSKNINNTRIVVTSIPAKKQINKVTQISTDLGSVAISNDITLPIYSLKTIFSNNPLAPLLKVPHTKHINNLKNNIHHKKHHILVGISIFAVILASVSLISIGNSRPKGGTLDSNVTIGGIDVSQQYPAEAKKNLLIASQKQQINIEVAGKTIQANAKDIGLTRDIDSAISQAESGRKTIAQKAVLKDNTPTAISIKSSIDQKVLGKFIAAKLGPDMIPSNAELKTDDGNLTIVPGKNGIAINSTTLSNQLNQIGLNSVVNIKTPSSQVPPDISTEAAQAANAKAESLIAANYVVGNDALGFKTIPKSQKVSWLAISPDTNTKNINVAINNEAAKKSFEGTAASFNKKPEEMTQVNIPGGNTIVLEEGINGINIPAPEIASASGQFVGLLNAGQGGTININPTIVPAGVRALNGPTSGKMILVDVPNFKAYAIENGNIANQTLVSTGQRGGETPAGVFEVRSKIKNVTLKGCAPAFGCWTVPNVPNVMTFDSRGDALHGTYWHNSFGKANLSHGCVNLPLGFADWLFDWTPVGTPVVVVR